MLDAFHDCRLSLWALWVFAGLMLLFLMLPTLIVVPLSFSASDLLEFPPRAYSLRWYETFFGSSNWMAALRTSLILGTLTGLIAVPSALLACLGMDRIGGKRAAGIYGVLLLPSVTPGILLAIGLFFVLAKLHLIGTLFGVLIGHAVLAIPVASIVIRPAVSRFDWLQVQAARSLGAGWGRAIFGIMLPQLRFSQIGRAHV